MSKPYRYLVIGDLHVKRDNLKEIHELHQKILQLIPGIDEVVILGDTLDRHETIHMQPLCVASRMIKEYSDFVPVTVLIGNHDRSNNTVYCTDESPFIQWSIIPPPRIRIVDKPIQVASTLYVPYVPNERFQEAISNFDLSTVKLIFAHQEFAGCRYNGITSNVKESWSASIRVISGHIHDCQEIGNLLYTGTPLQNDFNESSNKYVFYVDVSDTVTYTAVPIISVPKITIDTRLPIPDNIFSSIGTSKCKLVIHDSVANIETFTMSSLYSALKAMPNVKIILDREYETRVFISGVTYVELLHSILSDAERNLFSSLALK
jgi:predicted phosphodiesterase